MINKSKPQLVKKLNDINFKNFQKLSIRQERLVSFLKFLPEPKMMKFESSKISQFAF